MAAAGAACNASDPSKARGGRTPASRPVASIGYCRATFRCWAVADHTFAFGAELGFRNVDGADGSELKGADFPILAGGFFLLRKALAVGEMQQIEFCCFGSRGAVRVRRGFTRIRAAARQGGGTGTAAVHAWRRRWSAASGNR